MSNFLGSLQFFTYHDGRVEQAPVLPDIPVAFTSDQIRSGGQLPQLAEEVGHYLPLDYLIPGELGEPMSTSAGRAYITIKIMEQTLGYLPSYEQLMGSLWAIEGGARATEPSVGGIGRSGNLGDDLATVIAHRVQSLCSGTNLTACQPSEFLFMLGSYFEAYKNATASSLTAYLEPNNALYSETLQRGKDIVSQSLHVFSSHEPYFYGPEGASYPTWDPLRIYRDSGQAVWSSTGTQRIYPDGTVVNETINCISEPAHPECG